MVNKLLLESAKGLYNYYKTIYIDYKKYNMITDFIVKLTNDINYKIEQLNRGYYVDIRDGSHNPYDNTTIELLQLEVEEMTKLLNEVTEPEHETFTANLNKKIVSCSWDKVYKYIFLQPGTESIKYILVKVFDKWINHKLDFESVKPFLVDNELNVFVL